MLKFAGCFKVLRLWSAYVCGVRGFGLFKVLEWLGVQVV